MPARPSESALRYRPALIVSTSACLVFLSAGCKDHGQQPGPRPAPSASADAPATARPLIFRSPASETASAPVAPASSAPLPAGTLDLGPARPVAITPVGIVAIAEAQDVLVAPFREGKPQAFAAAVGQGTPAPVATGPSPVRVYWVAQNKLLRSELSADGKPGPIETLASDAINGLRPAAGRVEGPGSTDVVVYFSRTDGKDVSRVAKVWIEGSGAKLLSPDGAGASSADVVALPGGKVSLITLDGRLAMSPLHVRVLDVAGGGKLGPDSVVHVAGPAENNPEIGAIRIGTEPAVLVALPKESATFGLMSLKLAGATEVPAQWTMYPNGLTPALVVTAQICGKPAAAFVQPRDATPSSARTIQFSELNDQGYPTAPKTMAEAHAIRSMALGVGKSLKPAGGWLAYSGDGRLLARAVPCP